MFTPFYNISSNRLRRKQPNSQNFVWFRISLQLNYFLISLNINLATWTLITQLSTFYGFRNPHYRHLYLGYRIFRKFYQNVNREICRILNQGSSNEVLVVLIKYCKKFLRRYLFLIVQTMWCLFIFTSIRTDF